jgi:hypothetical protein
LTTHPSLVLSWMLVIGTVAGSCWAEQSLFRILATTATEAMYGQPLADNRPAFVSVAAA